MGHVDLWDWYINNMIIGSFIVLTIFIPMMYLMYWGIKELNSKENNNKQTGERHGNDTHVWQVIVNDIKHVVTLKAGWKDVLLLDGDEIESGTVWLNKDYNFQIGGEPALLTTRPHQHHDCVHKLYVSGTQIE